MSRYITVETEVDLYDYLGEIPDQDLIDELRSRGENIQKAMGVDPDHLRRALVSRDVDQLCDVLGSVMESIGDVRAHQALQDLKFE